MINYKLCGLRPVIEAQGWPKQGDPCWKYACKHIACHACGSSVAYKALSRYFARDYCYVGYVARLVFCWKNLPVHSDSVASVLQFLEALGRLRDGFTDCKCDMGWHGLILASHFNFLPNTSGKFQPHVHVGLLLCEPMSSEQIAYLQDSWKRLSGAEVLIQQEEGSLDGFASYIARNPLSTCGSEHKKPTKTQSFELHRRVMSEVERQLGKTAFVSYVEGVYKSPEFFVQQKILARKKLGLLDETASEKVLKGVHIVLLSIQCERCFAKYGDLIRYGRTSAGNPRFMCKICKKTVVPKVFTQVHSKQGLTWHVSKGQISLMRRFYNEGKSLNEIARTLKKDRRTIKKHLLQKPFLLSPLPKSSLYPQIIRSLESKVFSGKFTEDDLSRACGNLFSKPVMAAIMRKFHSRFREKKEMEEIVEQGCDRKTAALT